MNVFHTGRIKSTKAFLNYVDFPFSFKNWERSSKVLEIKPES